MNEAMSYHTVFVLLLVPAYVRAISVEPEGGVAAGGDSKTCDARECKETVDMIKRQMGEEKPCNDFYDYVCSKWSGDRELKSRYMKKKALQTLIGLLENAADPSSEAANAMDKLVLAYKSCTKKGNGTAALKASIGKVIALYNLTMEGWPVIRGKSHWRNEDGYKRILRKTGPRPLFSYSVLRNEHLSSGNDGPMILMEKPTEFYVHDIEDYSVVETSGSEGEATEPAYDYSSISAKEEEAYKTFIIQSILLLKDSVGGERAEGIAKNIIEMEKSLEKLASGAKKADVIKMTLSQLGKNLSDPFPMVPILRKDFEHLNVTIDGKTEVLVKHIDYYKAMVEFIKCSNMTTLVNYILWTNIRSMAQAQGTELHKIYLEYKRNTSIFNLTDIPSTFEENGISGTSNISLLCTRQLLQNDIMLAAGASYYIRARFGRTSKDDVLKMMSFVKAGFTNFLIKNTWMSNATKTAAIEKMDKMEHIIGYPDWMLNDTTMNDLYQFVPPFSADASFVEPFYFLQENERKQALLQLQDAGYFNKPHEDTPLRSHVDFDEETNTIVYPAAALVTHYKSSPIPRSVNYGSIGVILAQLFSRIIDRYSDVINGTGRYKKDNWDEETAKHFCSRSSCLNNTEECNNANVPPSDKHEKLHDYLGVRVAYEAMKNSRKDYESPFTLLDDKIFDTEEKIFFIFFGNLYCPISINEAPVQSRADVEEEFSKSLNDIVYNYVEFNKTFGCKPLGEDMCDLMPPVPKNPPSC